MRVLGVLGLALAFIGIGASVLDLPDEVGYACFALAGLSIIVALVMALPSPKAPLLLQGQGAALRESKAARGPGNAATLIPVDRTNDSHFSRVEAATDSLGHTAERQMGDVFWAVTEHVLRPGQQVVFELEVSDPNGDRVALSVLTPALTRADVAISDGVVTWTVRDEDIADPAQVHLFVTSLRDYQRFASWDDVAMFVYRVLPRL